MVCSSSVQPQVALIPPNRQNPLASRWSQKVPKPPTAISRGLQTHDDQGWLVEDLYRFAAPAGSMRLSMNASIGFTINIPSV
jgi:hypothetical protein